MKFPAVAGGVTSDTPQSGRRCSCEMRISCHRIRKSARKFHGSKLLFGGVIIDCVCVCIYIYIYVYCICIYVCLHKL